MKQRGDEIGYGSFGGRGGTVPRKGNIHMLCTMNIIHNLYYGRTCMLRKCLFFSGDNQDTLYRSIYDNLIFKKIIMICSIALIITKKRKTQITTLFEHFPSLIKNCRNKSKTTTFTHKYMTNNVPGLVRTGTSIKCGSVKLLILY